MARSNSPNERNAFVCGVCSKGYSRRDYLERHELNHNSPSCICPACGKSFARPDVLRKHLSTSCKLRRGSDDGNAPLTSAEEDAIIPRKRRRTKAPRVAASPTPSASSSASTSNADANSVSSASSAKVATPLSPATASASSPRSEPAADERMNAHYARLRSLQEQPRFLERTLSVPSINTSAPGPAARAGASLDQALAPAFAATPETFPDLTLNPSALLSSSAPSSAPTVAPTAKPEPAPLSIPDVPTWSTSANDDLLSWLFTVTSTVPGAQSNAGVSPGGASVSSGASVGADAWPVTPSEGTRKLSDASDFDFGLPDLPLSFSGNGLDMDLSTIPGLRGLPGMPEFGDRGYDWLAASGPHQQVKPKQQPKDTYDPYAYDAGTMNQMRLYYELYFKQQPSA